MEGRGCLACLLLYINYHYTINSMSQFWLYSTHTNMSRITKLCFTIKSHLRCAYSLLVLEIQVQVHEKAYAWFLCGVWGALSQWFSMFPKNYIIQIPKKLELGRQRTGKILLGVGTFHRSTGSLVRGDSVWFRSIHKQDTVRFTTHKIFRDPREISACKGQKQTLNVHDL